MTAKKPKESPYKIWQRMSKEDSSDAMIRILEQYDTPLDAPMEMLVGSRFLHLAAERGLVGLVGWLLDHGANPNLMDLKGYTPLFYAVSARSLACMELLLAAHADPDLRAHSTRAARDRTTLPLMRAYELGMEEAVKMLLESRASIDPIAQRHRHHVQNAFDEPDANPLTALDHYVQEYLTAPWARADHIDKARLLAADNEGRSMLSHPRTWAQFPAILERLGKHGEYLGKKDFLGTDAVGKNWLVRATECRQFNTVLRYLNQRGEGVGPADVLTREGQLNPLGQMLVAKGQIPYLFTQENAPYANSRSGFWTIYQALPPEGKAQIRNMHTLMLRLGATLDRDIATGRAGSLLL